MFVSMMLAHLPILIGAIIINFHIMIPEL